MKYYRLTDNYHYNDIIKEEKGKEYRYCYGAEKWIRHETMVLYMWPDDPLYDMYEEISEQEAKKLISKCRKEYNRLLDLAIKVATEAHKGQVDKGGNPYILHVKTVADALDSTEEKIVAYLHDVCEDTNTTVEDLSEMGFTDKIVNSVDILTRKEYQTYEEYLIEIKDNLIACNVKMADIKNNMDISRIPKPTKKDYNRLKKYEEALKILQE